MEPDDMALVREYAASQSEPAFARLVARHLNFVYSSALRRTGDARLAEEVAQGVFIILARKAGTLAQGWPRRLVADLNPLGGGGAAATRTSITGWLYRATQFVATSARRQARRRQQREQEAYMQSILDRGSDASSPSGGEEVWQQIAPVLEAALDKLNARDRDAVLLRFFENRTLAEVGAALDVSEDGARVRVNRALEKLRNLFAKRGVDSTADAITSAIAGNSIQIAPVALAKTVTALAIAKGAAASISALTIVKGALNAMTWAQAKIPIVVGAAIILVATTGTVVFKAVENSAAPKLQMRTFKVNPRVFLHNLIQTTKFTADTAVTNIFPAYLESKGISIRPPKAIAFNDNAGLLFVKATAADLKAIENIVVQLDYSPPQVHIKTYFLEVPESDVPSVLAAGTAINTPDNHPVEILDDNKMRQLLGLLRSHGAKTLAQPESVVLFSRQVETRASNATADLVPTLLEDGHAIKMKMMVRSSETWTTEANLWDNQTLATGSLSSGGQTRLFVFATATMIDAAGNRIYSQADLRSKLGTIPPQ